MAVDEPFCKRHRVFAIVRKLRAARPDAATHPTEPNPGTEQAIPKAENERTTTPNRRSVSRRARREQADPEALARLVDISRESDEHLILVNGPVTPDAALLDQAALALHFMVQAERLYDEYRDIIFGPNGSASIRNHSERDRLHAKARAAWDEAAAITRKAKPIMIALAKQPAKTAAGIYAKALIVRGSRTGAEKLAQSLARDLAALPALRASLWREVQS